MTRFTAFSLAVLFWTVQAQAAGLVASVDRSRLNSGETVELTLESSDVTLFGKPDLTPLEPLFEVRGTRQVNQLNTLNGDNQATTRWIITLLPRQNGSVVIPSLQLGEVQSQPITVQVVESEAQDTTNKLAPVFIDASLDQTSVYVQAQAILTLRIYHSVSLYDDSSLPPLQIPDARIEQLGESRTYEKAINGLRHGVIEMRYAIYPQHSGELIIPAQVFNAALVDAQPAPDAGAQTPKTGKLMRVSSSELLLTVKAKPASYPADAPWLPARSLSLSESWNPEPEHAQVGDSLTRSLTVKAEGLASSQLPPLPATDVNGLRRYPDQPVLSNQNGDRGLIGSREEREALVPVRSGSIELPAVDVVWWNTFEDHLEHSSLPAQSLEVANNPSMVVDTPASAPQAHSAADSETLWRWKLSTLILACTTLIGFGLWWRARWQPAILRATQTGPSPRTVL
ncbi:protein BatD, partial [Pseudomonas sp. PB120]|uniref:BatD family protein n=1 Tax=Pseudomonas sp. PB120 TaxID=2494700 RepID=UPI0012FD4CAC